MEIAERIKGLFLIIIFFVALYALAVFPAAPWLLPLVIIGAVLVYKGDKVLLWLAKLSEKLGRKRVKAEEREVRIPEGVPQTVEIPKREELAKMAVDKILDIFYKIASQQNQIIAQQNATISELRGQLDQMKSKMEEVEKKNTIIRQWLGVKDEKELMKKLAQLGFASYLYGVPVVGKDGKKKGTFVALVPDPLSGRLLCLVENAYGNIVPAGWGLTVAHPKIFPLFDPASWNSIVKEMQEYASVMLEGGKTIRWGDIMDHALVLSEYAEGAPQYIDKYAELSFPKDYDKIEMVVAEDRDTALALMEQRNRIQQLEEENRRLRFELDEAEREIDHLRGIAAMAIQRVLMQSRPDKYEQLVAVTESYAREMKKSDLHRRVLSSVEEAHEEAEEVREKLETTKRVEARELAGSTIFEIAEDTLNRMRKILEPLKSPESVMAEALMKMAAKEEKRKQEEAEKSVQQT
mgnify:CR=1 FL=1